MFLKIISIVLGALAILSPITPLILYKENYKEKNFKDFSLIKISVSFIIIGITLLIAGIFILWSSGILE